MKRLLPAVVVLLASCVPTLDRAESSEPPSNLSSETTAGADAGVTPDAGLQNDQGGPVFLTVGTNVSTIFEGESFVVSAVLTHPEGVNKVIGGVLRNDQNALLGAFATTNTNGAFSMTVSWSALNQVEPIHFTRSLERALVASFYDEEGRRAERTVRIGMQCKAPSTGACGGDCMNLDKEVKHCGSCGNACTGPSPSCVSGQCQPCSNGETLCGGKCVNLMKDKQNCGRCGNVLPDGFCFQGQHACFSGDQICGGHCTDVQHNNENCGSCGTRCTGTTTCKNGSCQACATPFDCQRCTENLNLSCADVCAQWGMTCKPATGSVVGVAGTGTCSIPGSWSQDITSCQQKASAAGTSAVWCYCF